MRAFSTLRGLPRHILPRIFGGAIAAGGAAGALYTFCDVTLPRYQFARFSPLVASCAQKFMPQSSVINETKNHALYLTIHLKDGVTTDDCLKALSEIYKHVDTICPPDLRDENDEIWYGVGFGENFMNKLKGDQKPNGLMSYTHRTRKGLLGDMPHTGGDIFIHAKCNERGKLFELCQAVVRSLPKDSISKFEDIYGWVYRGGRDLTGFIDGTENPAGEEERTAAAIDPKTGGSYVITQKWIHDHNAIQSTKDSIKQQYVGRDINDSTELRKKTATAHVSRMTGSSDFEAPAKFEIVRHSQPYGTFSGDSGLFFIAYSATPAALDFMLDRMTGHDDDKKSDDIMHLTKCVQSTYWFFPSQPHLDKLFGKKTASTNSFWR